MVTMVPFRKEWIADSYQLVLADPLATATTDLTGRTQ
jgi:hypothetical protein